MKCSDCSNPAVTYKRYEGRSLCSEHFIQTFEARVKKTIREERLIEPGDKVCVALSGGKDSSVALIILSSVLRDWRDTELFALLIDEGIDGYRNESLEIAKKLCGSLGVALHIARFKETVHKTMDEIMEESPLAKVSIGNKALPSHKENAEKKFPCTYCGVFRRDLLNSKSRELGATKLATGHNMDDELQSAFMNYFRLDINKASRLGATPSRKNELFVQRIKPLRYLPEYDVGLYAVLKGLDVHETECPYANNSLRFHVRDFLNKMEEKYPGIKFSAMHAYDSLLGLLRASVDKEINRCECGEATAGTKCRKCELLATLKT